MNRISGTYITQTVAGESYKAYVPIPLPPDPPLDMTRLYPLLEKASLALAELNTINALIPNHSLFVCMYVRKEALLSSQIEGTQSSFANLILFENQQHPDVLLEDVEEVSNYVKAINYGLERIKGGFPLSLRLLREVHGVLLAGTRGATKLPGEFRQSQNWIGGTRPGNALFVPPPVDPPANHLGQCLADLEKFLHDESIHPLIKAGLAHVQFETIHPFLDGNGRLGRLLITLLLCINGLLESPILYLSLYLKQNRQVYYELLQEVRLHGTWETWLEFFLDGVCKSAKQAVQAARDITTLFEQDALKIAELGRVRFACEKIFEYLKRLPQVSVPHLAVQLDMTAPTIRSGLNELLKLEVVEEITGGKRDRVYVYRRYLTLLEAGAEPLPV